MDNNELDITYALAKPEDYDEIIEHANFVFSYAHRPHEFKTLLPKTYGEDRTMWPEHFLARENGRIRGLVGLLPYDLTVNGDTIRVGFIGTVSVHHYARGRGYMKRCMAMSTEYALDHGIDIMALGGQRQRYEYYGYEPGGTQHIFNVTATNCRHRLGDADVGGIEFIPFEKAAEHIDAAYALYEAGVVGGARPRENFEQICRSWYNRPFVILDGGEAIGYLIASSECDCIHELRLNDIGALWRVVKAFLERFHRKNVEIEVPPHMPEYVRSLAALSEDITTGTNEMFMILNYPRVIETYLRLKQKIGGRLPDGELLLGITGIPGQDGQRNIRISVQSGDITAEYTDDEPMLALTSLDAQNMLLAPVPCVDMAMLPAFARAWFPLPVYIESADGF